MEKFRNAVAIIHRDENPPDAGTVFYEWLLDTIWKVPVLTADAASPPPRDWARDDELPFCSVLALAGADGRANFNSGWWPLLKRLGNFVPVHFFHRAAEIKEVAELLEIRPAPLFHLWPAPELAHPAKTGSPFSENDPARFLEMLENIFSVPGPPLVRAAPLPWPVCFRMDDVPTNWRCLQLKSRLLGPADYAKLGDTLRNCNAKMNFMVTPTLARGGKNLEWSDPAVAFPGTEILKTLVKLQNEGRAELGAHGWNHLSAGLKRPMSQLKIRVINRLSADAVLPTREFFDPVRRRPIPYEEQFARIVRMRDAVEKITGTRPTSFTPPAHAWDAATECALAEAGFTTLACDLTLAELTGATARAVSLPGRRAWNAPAIMCVSKMISYPSGENAFKAFRRAGIPLIMSTHNHHPHLIEAESLERLIALLGAPGETEFVTVGGMAEIFRKWSRVKIDMWSSGGRLVGVVDTPLPLEIRAGGSSLRITAPGRHEVEIA